MNNFVLGLIVLLIIFVVGYYLTIDESPLNVETESQIQQQQLVQQQQQQQQLVQQQQQQVVQQQQQQVVQQQQQQNSLNNNKSKVLPQTLNLYNRLNLNKINGTACYSHNQCVGRSLDKFYCGNNRQCKMCPKDIMNKRMFLVNRDTVDGMYPSTCGDLNNISCNNHNNCSTGNYCSKSNFGQVCVPCSACPLYNDGIDGNCSYRCAPSVRILDEPQAANTDQLVENTYGLNEALNTLNNVTEPVADITGPAITTSSLAPTTAALAPTTAALAPTTDMVLAPPTEMVLPSPTTAALAPPHQQ